ncbi:outer membrane channel protein TolC [Vibrio penaeicida]|uniref:Outer membrane protein TolC n=1 Tax=Vibrio penaeicida TaxID=104609 RepID=A0AAV5NT08_9VIBR|nr:outer membrane channel protein TolC [Vibrio penaeicida]RTZ23276.1 outer membrane channel protein TolC [Vibrio penaeicida]GLQ73851.1 outer membrane protein TolC [Vibrio penaeicida]
MKKLLPLLITAALGSNAAWADNLAEIYDLAKQNDPQLLSAAAQREAAFEAVNSSRSTLLPQIDLTAGYNIQQSSKSDREGNALTAGVGLKQDLYNRNSWINLDKAEKSARQVDSAYAAEQQGLILRVATAYFEVLRAQDSLDFVRAEKAAVARQLEQTKQRFEVGLSAITDVHDAQAQYDSVLASEVLQENALANSYEALREITGEEHQKLATLDTRRFAASRPESTTESLIEKAQQENLSLLATRIKRDIAKNDISLAESGHLPTLTLNSGYKYTDNSNTLNGTGDGSFNDFNIGVNLSVPLYTGGNITSLVKKAEANYVEASQRLEQTYRTVVKDVRAHYNNINANIGAIRAYNQSVVSAQSALEATEAGFDVGTRTIVDVLDSTRRLYDANRNLSDARYNYILSVLQLRQAVGTLNEQDVLDINTGLKPVS